MLSRTLRAMGAALWASTVAAQAPRPSPAPIIDVHLHALPAMAFGPPPVQTCARELTYPPRDPRDSLTLSLVAECAHHITSPVTDSAILERTLTILRRYNITAMTSGPMDMVRAWKDAAPHSIIAAAGIEPHDSIQRWARDGAIRVLGELAFQYQGIGPGDSIPESYYALAERLDLPVGLHVGLGPPGAPYVGDPRYRMRLSNPLLLEDVLVRHPKLRLYVMHAGWPMIDEMIALLYAHPQVYVDIGVIDWFLPRTEFYSYLRRLVDAGFGRRIMFGSDQMIWPDAIPVAIDAVQSAPFLTAAQKRDIFYNNAVRFFRLTPTSAADGRSP